MACFLASIIILVLFITLVLKIMIHLALVVWDRFRINQFKLCEFHVGDLHFKFKQEIKDLLLSISFSLTVSLVGTKTFPLKTSNQRN